MVSLNSKKLGDILSLINGILLIFLINLLVSRYFFRVDLTSEKRFSLDETTRQVLDDLEDNVFVDVYLDGDLPPGFKRLQLTIRETLEQFKVYSSQRVQFTFIDPDQAATTQSRNEFMMSIAQKGIQPTDILLTKNGNRIQKRILPGAIVTYGGHEKGVLLLKGNKGRRAEEQLNQSAEEVEFQLASTIRQLTKDRPERIGFVIGHGELEGNDIRSFKETLNDQYVISDIALSADDSPLKEDLLIIGKPVTRFTREEKFVLDQFILSGGKVIFLIDAVNANTDSVSISFPYDLNLDDQLFRYGVRINKDLVQDMFCLSEPIVVGNLGDRSQVQMLPWPFYPLLNTFSEEQPIVRNLDAIRGKYISSIDTVKAEGIRKTPLIFTSPYSRVILTPLKIDLNELKKPLDPDAFNKSNVPVGYLLEGEFTSLFRNRPLPAGAKPNNFKEKGESAIIVISDGDIARNDLDPKSGNPLPLGFDLYNSQTFANEDFLMNAIQYLLDDQGLIQSRNKEIILRPLDKVKLGSERLRWQLFNLIGPVVLLILFGILNNYIRKQKYSSF